jgi:hypothetical protein
MSFIASPFFSSSLSAKPFSQLPSEGLDSTPSTGKEGVGVGDGDGDGEMS